MALDDPTGRAREKAKRLAAEKAKSAGDAASKAADSASKMTDAAGDAASKAKGAAGKAKGVAGGAVDKMSGAAGDATSKATGAASKMSGAAGGAASKMTGAASKASGGAKSRIIGAAAGAAGAGGAIASITRHTETTTTTRRRKRTVTSWDRDPAAWAPGKVGALAALPLVGGLLIGGTAWAVPHIEKTLERQTIADLEAAGIDTSDLDVDYDYRTGSITGSAAAGVDAGTLEAKGDGSGVRNLSALLAAGAVKAEQETPVTTEAAAEEPAAVEVGPTDVTAMVEDGRIVLRGEVLSEAQRQTLVDAAEATGVEVVDELTVSGFDEATPGADARVAGLAGLISNLGPGVTGVATLSDTSLAFVGEAPDADIAAAVEAAVADAGSGLETSAEVSAPEATDDAAELAARLAALGPVHYKLNMSCHDGEAVALLDEAVAILQEYPGVPVELVGHTDKFAAQASNQALSERRASEVVDYLVEHGVDPERLSSSGMGEDAPIGDNETAVGRRENRRTEFQVKLG